MVRNGIESENKSIKNNHCDIELGLTCRGGISIFNRLISFSRPVQVVPNTASSSRRNIDVWSAVIDTRYKAPEPAETPKCSCWRHEKDEKIGICRSNRMCWLEADYPRSSDSGVRPRPSACRWTPQASISGACPWDLRVFGCLSTLHLTNYLSRLIKSTRSARVHPLVVPNSIHPEARLGNIETCNPRQEFFMPAIDLHKSLLIVRQCQPFVTPVTWAHSIRMTTACGSWIHAYLSFDIALGAKFECADIAGDAVGIRTRGREKVFPTGGAEYNVRSVQLSEVWDAWWVTISYCDWIWRIGGCSPGGTKGYVMRVKIGM